MHRRRPLRRAGATLALAALLTSIVAAATVLLLTSRLSSEKALLDDMDLIIETVADEAVANTESFLVPAAQTVDLLTSFLADGVFDPSDPDSTLLLLDVLESSASFDGIYIGSPDGEFLYVYRATPGSDATFESKKISYPGGERTVEVTTFDEALTVRSKELDESDFYDPRTRVWYQEASTERGPSWTNPYLFFSSGLPGVTRTSPVYEGDSLRHVVGLDIRIAALSDFMAERAPSPNGGAFVITKSRQMVAYPDLEAIGDGRELRRASAVDDAAVQHAGNWIQSHFDDESSTGADTITLGDDRAHFFYATLEANEDWIVAAWSPQSDFLPQVREQSEVNRRISLALGVLILLELMVAALWVYRQLSSNYLRLQESEAAIARSSTERDRAQSELAETNEQLAASNRDLEEYAYAAAHDLRTPLRAIGGYSELIGREVESDDADLGRVREWAERIVAGYDRMSRIMDNLLEHARLSRVGIDSNDLERVSTTEIAESVAADLRSRLDEIAAEVHIGQLPETRAEPVQLTRVFQNLLENAIRFRSPERPLRVEIDGSASGEFVSFTVRDNGVGISGIDKSRIFESFRTVNDNSSGVGLGLALVKRIVEDHGGEIQVESVVGIGTTFEFTLRGAVAMSESTSS